MSARDRRSQRIRDQIRAHPNPRSGHAALVPRSFHEQLRRVYAMEDKARFHHDPAPAPADLIRRLRRRR